MHSNKFIRQGVPLAAALFLTALLSPAKAQEAVQNPQQPSPGAETPLQQFLKQKQARAEARRKQLLKRLPLIPFKKAIDPATLQGRTGSNRLPGAPVIEPETMTPEETDALMQAIRQRDQMPGPSFARKGGGNAGVSGRGAGSEAVNPINTPNRWISTGPNQMDPPYPNPMGILPMAGRVNAIAWDPQRTNILYAATANGGLWRLTIDYTLNGPQPTKPGNSPATVVGVQPLSDYSFPILRTSSVAVHPKTTRIIYVGTGDFDGGSGAGLTGVGVGIMKTVNDGRTWAKIADRDANGPIFEGTSVSSIIIDPENNKHLIASSGRGTTPGNVWNSYDEGNTWAKAQLVGGGTLPPGDWSKIDYSSKRPDRTRSYYATNINDGVYRSDDAGATWQKLAVPLAFNAQGVGNLNLKVAASKLATAPDYVYVMDDSGAVSDGRIFKSTDRGATWVGITGNYPYVTGGDNNWFASFSNTVLTSAVVPVNVFDTEGNPINTVAREALFGGSRALSASLGIGVKVGSAIYGGGLDIGAGLTWNQVSLDPLDFFWTTHNDQHGFAQSPDNIQLFARFGVANDGGVYILEYLAGGVDINQFYDIDSDFGFNFNVDVNSSMVVQPLLSADFFLRDDGEMRGIAGGNNIGAPKFAATLTAADTIVKWDTVPLAPASISNALVYDAFGRMECTPDKINTDGIPDGDDTPVLAGNYGAAGLFAPSDPTGDTQYVFVDNGGNGNWPYRRLLYTTDNWATGLDISPDRYLVPDSNNELIYWLDKNGNGPLYLFNTIEPKDSATPTAWQGDAKPAYGAKVAMAESLGGGLYFGTSHLWRYDPPGILHDPLPGPVKMPCGSLPNAQTDGTGERGVWRQVGTQAFGGYITAIAVSPINQAFVYVGTSTGEIWWTDRAYLTNTSMPLPGYIAPWNKLAGGGTSNLPARPIYDITVNPSVAGSGDITVTLGGAAGVSRVWRNANSVTQTFFTDQSGQASQALPDVAVNGIARDFDDPFNTFFVATDLGVFVTIDGGSTWTNATAPLGLPNAKCVSLKIVRNNTGDPATNQKALVVATAGRGVWRYDLKDLVQTIEKPILTTTSTINRVGNQLVINVSIKNSGGPAFNVRLTKGAIEAVGQVFNTSSFPVGGNINIGTLGKNQTQVITLRFSGNPPLYPFTSANIRIAGKYTEPPIPPGVEKDFNNDPGYHTRLP